eukprot:9353093-Pyramimonas_sp.AAC.1
MKPPSSVVGLSVLSTLLGQQPELPSAQTDEAHRDPDVKRKDTVGQSRGVKGIVWRRCPVSAWTNSPCGGRLRQGKHVDTHVDVPVAVP